LEHIKMNVTRISVALASFLAVACPARKDVQCTGDGDCGRHSGGTCLTSPAGHQWCAYLDPGCQSGYRYSDLDVGDGVSGACVGAAADAGIDAPPGAPIVENGQLADLVLGQESFLTQDPNHGGLSASSMLYPVGLSVSESGALWLLDAGNFRALKWITAPVSSFQAANIVAGSSSFTTAQTGAITATTLSANSNGILAASGKLMISDSRARRVLIWDPSPTTNGQAANIVLGQTDFTGQKFGEGASDFRSPSGIWTDGTRLAIADVGNNRVLIWTTFPTANNQPANIVLGQPGFGSNALNPPSSTSMHFPSGVYFDGTRFYVAVGPENRVLVWNSFPTTNGQAADYVIGQLALDTSDSGYLPYQMRYPSQVLTVGNNLFVADASNSRVLVFSPIPTSSGASAKYVLGAPDFTAPGIGRVTQSTFDANYGIAVQGHELYVVDPAYHRVLRFHLTF
jgi:hypothetical protein